MKLKFKRQDFQALAVDAVVDCFAGQQRSSGIKYHVDPGHATSNQQSLPQFDELSGFKNAPFSVPLNRILENVQAVQRRQNLPMSTQLAPSVVSSINLDVEMETGTGKTYCYIKTMFELHKQYGWSKFIVIVPSIAIREGVKKSFEITSDHFMEDYGERARVFIYDSKQLHNIERFSSESGVNVMVINVQAFNATGRDARRIYEELDDFQTRRPIDVISANRPILILDEPQKMEGKKTVDSLTNFKPMIILRYSATHKIVHNKVYRLDALDSYNRKLVKKIAVRGISIKGLSGTNAYLYVGSIDISHTKPPTARVELEIKQVGGIKRVHKNLGKGDNLFDLSGGLDQYKGFVITDIDARTNTVSFSNGVDLQAGDATGDVNDSTLRRIQIREAIRAHFEKEQVLFSKGIKVLTLFFIDEVAKYRMYNESGQVPGEYAEIFEEEYAKQRDENLTMFGDTYDKYLKGIEPSQTHNGYFSIDKKTRRLVDPAFKKTGESKGETDDVDAFDLILKDKERLLSFEEPTRFIFSHSALREGWDNPNVFVICALKHSDNTVSRRQEVGRGMRLAVNQFGDRQDDPATVHQVNILTVVASESYKDFVSALQKDISNSLSERPKVADEAYFTGKILRTETGDVPVTPQLARLISRYLVKNDYTDTSDRITSTFHEAKESGTLAALPTELAPHADHVFTLISSVFSDAQLPEIDDERAAKSNPLNSNFEKKEFQALWQRINHKAIYTVHFETDELIGKCVRALNKELNVTPLQYTIQAGEQKDQATFDELRQGSAFELKETNTDSYNDSVQSTVKYDLLGKMTESTQLTRKTVAQILGSIEPVVFKQFQMNPEDFIMKAGRLINEQKATVIVEHLSYDKLEDRHEAEIFTRDKTKKDFGKATKVDRHIYDYVFTDSNTERTFVRELDTSAEVVVYAKLPKSFFIPTPVGNYNPDWAIAFEEGKVKHIYFIAETKGSMSSMELRKIEECKMDCARRFFAKITSDQVKYDIVNSYAKLMELVK